MQKYIDLYHSSSLKQKTLPSINIEYKLRGKSRLGSAKLDSKNGCATINVHLEAYGKLGELYLKEVFAHEFAHIVTFLLYGRCKPHGSRFCFVCKELFPQDFPLVARASRALDVELASAREVKRYAYKCDCSTHMLSSFRHNKIVKKMAIYRCKKCNSELRSR